MTARAEESRSRSVRAGPCGRTLQKRRRQITEKSTVILPAVWAASTTTGTGETAFTTSATGRTAPLTFDAWVKITSEVGARVTLAMISSADGTPSDDRPLMVTSLMRRFSSNQRSGRMTALCSRAVVTTRSPALSLEAKMALIQNVAPGPKTVRSGSPPSNAATSSRAPSTTQDAATVSRWPPRPGLPAAWLRKRATASATSGAFGKEVAA